jgi:hypothetical protein
LGLALTIYTRTFVFIRLKQNYLVTAVTCQQPDKALGLIPDIDSLVATQKSTVM